MLGAAQRRVFLKNLQAQLTTKPCQLVGPWAMRENMCDLQHISLAHSVSAVRKNLDQSPASPLGPVTLVPLGFLRDDVLVPCFSLSSLCSGLELWVNHQNQRWKEMHEVISSCPCQRRIIPHSTVLSAFSSLFLNDSKERAFLSSPGRLALLLSRPHCWGILFLFFSLNCPFP